MQFKASQHKMAESATRENQFLSPTFLSPIRTRRTMSYTDIIIDGAGIMYMEEEMKAKRHHQLVIVQSQIGLSPEEGQISIHKNYLQHLKSTNKRFEIQLPIDKAPKLSFTLPLPQVSQDQMIDFISLQFDSMISMPQSRLIMFFRGVF